VAALNFSSGTDFHPGHRQGRYPDFRTSTGQESFCRTSSREAVSENGIAIVTAELGDLTGHGAAHGDSTEDPAVTPTRTQEAEQL
jgi:hypothetical protein